MSRILMKANNVLNYCMIVGMPRPGVSSNLRCWRVPRPTAGQCKDADSDASINAISESTNAQAPGPAPPNTMPLAKGHKDCNHRDCSTHPD